MSYCVRLQSNKATNLPSEFVDTNKTSSYCGGTELRDVDRHHVRATTNSKASKHATADDQTESSISIGSKHHTSTDHEL
jgi:hypothetical protein